MTLFTNLENRPLPCADSVSMNPKSAKGTTSRKWGRTLLLLGAVLSTPCTSAAQRPSGGSGIASTDTLSLPYRQFAKFLSLAVATRTPYVSMVDSVYTSGEMGIDERYREMRWVAAYQVLAVRREGKLAKAVAVITSVARQTDTGHGYVARYGIRDDTAHWVLVRSADARGRWVVIGDAAEGFGVFHIGRDVRWLTGSRATALAAVDSIRRARGLPVVR
jgi:hypothetical protein